MSTSDTDAGRNIEQESRPNAELRDLDEREPETIERELDATRADMRATLEALERRFSFDRLVELTIGRVRERGGEFAGNLTNAATQNPLPLLLTTIGLSWMMLTSRRAARSDASAQYAAGGSREQMGNLRERAASASDTIHGAVDSTRDTLRQAAESSRDALRGAAESSREALRSATQSSRETLEHTAASLRSGASRAAQLTREQADHARDRMDRLLHEQPLMLGALGLAAGAIIGALLPATEHEDRLLGEARRKAVKAVAEKSRARFEQARENAAAYSAPAGARGEEEDESSARPASRPH